MRIIKAKKNRTESVSYLQSLAEQARNQRSRSRKPATA
jgi:hypothetical protein